LALTCFSAPSASIKLEAQLIWGSNEQTSPDTKHKQVAPELLKKLKELPLKWTNYFEVKRIPIEITSGEVRKVPLSEKCSLELKSQGQSKIEVVLFGKGKEVLRRTQELPRGETLILGGNAPGATSWFVVLRRLQ